MSAYRVLLSGFQSATITVDAEDPDDAIEQALNEGVPGICAQCSGWGHKWSRDDGEEWTADAVVDAAGAEVWVGPTASGEAVIRELGVLRQAVLKVHSSAECGHAVALIDARIKTLRDGK